MEPMIFELGKKKCYIIVGNQLLINVYKTKIEEYVRSYSAGIPVKKVTVFKLDQSFSMSYAEKTSDITFSDANTSKHKVYYEGNDRERLLQWLNPILEQNEFSPKVEALSGGKLLRRGIGSIVAVLLIFGAFYGAEGARITSNTRGKSRLFISIANALGERMIIIIGAICLLLAIIYTVRLIKKGEAYITYSR